MWWLFVGGMRLGGEFSGRRGVSERFGRRYWALGALVVTGHLYSSVLTDRERRAIVGCVVVERGMVVGGLGVFEGHNDGGGRGHCSLLESRGIRGGDGELSDRETRGRRLYCAGVLVNIRGGVFFFFFLTAFAKTSKTRDTYE